MECLALLLDTLATNLDPGKNRINKCIQEGNRLQAGVLARLRLSIGLVIPW